MTKQEFIDWLCLEVSGIVVNRDEGFAVEDYTRDENGVTVDFVDGTSLWVSVV